MAKIRPLFISEDYNSTGQFVPPNPYGQEVSVGRETQGGDDQDMERDLQADIGAQPIKAFPINEVVTEFTREQYNEIIKKIFIRFGIHQEPEFGGQGTMGVIYFGEGKVFKLTTDKSEVGEASKIINVRNSYLADVYGVYKIYKNLYLILCEKLITDYKHFETLYYKLDEIYLKINPYGISVLDMFDLYKKNRGKFNKEYKPKFDQELAQLPEVKTLFDSILKIIDELKAKGIHSKDYHIANLGYKANGNIGFFDFGMSDGKVPKDIDVIMLENQLYERVLSFMPGSKAMTVKKKCQLGGNGDGTSTACNQGDISNLDLKGISEEEGVDGFHMDDAHKEIVNMDMDSALHEISNDDLLYRKWKRDNVTYRGISDTTGQDGDNGGMAMLGRGLYSVPASNKIMARKYGKLRILVNAKPKNPKIFNTLNDWEIWFQNNVVFPISKAKGKTYPDGRDVNSITDEMLKRGYDGVIIKGREIVNYKPENVRYYENERQLEMYYDDFVHNNSIGESELVGMDTNSPRPNNSMYIPETIINEVMDNFLSLLSEEKKDVKVEYGAVILKLDIKGWDKIISMIDKDDVYDKPTFGVEEEPHITVLYGLHENVTIDEVKKIIESVHDIKKLINVELTNISIFEVKGQEYDVVKFDVKSDELHKMNTALKKLPYTSDFPDYHPHMTISYVKKGTAKKYEEKLKNSIKLQSKNLVYSTKDEKKTRLNENKEINVNSLPFKIEIEQAGGKIYSVGGAVRDHILQKPSKDLDLLITGLPLDKLEVILSKYGKVDAVGKSFGIIKFNTTKTGELDIAIPRTEKATGQGGYQGFDVKSDHELPIEKDLERRDFTINAIAKDGEGNLIDPYYGVEDIKNKIIRMVNPQAFKDDPLRMIRAVQFAARFGFTIEPKTLKAIQDNASRIKEISPERILIEFDKIVKKGNPVIGAQLLEETGLYQQIFGVENKINYTEMSKVKSMGEFIFILTSGAISSPSEFYKDKLKGDLDTYNEIRAYELAYKHSRPNDVQTKLNIFGMDKLSPKSLESGIIPHDVKQNIDEMKKMGMPFSMKELQINGNDLLALGYTGQQIGKLLKDLIVDIYSGKLRNNRDLLLRHLTPKIQEV